MSKRDVNFNNNNKGRRLWNVKHVIPGSRLAAVGDFYVFDPAVCEGDDVYELSLTRDDNGDVKVTDRRSRRQETKSETWMLRDTEFMFLECIVGE